MIKKKIIIIGAGISGLSCAYDLIENSNYQIEIYESSQHFGGQARSVSTEKCYAPYAWRIWSELYYNFLDIISNIPNNENGGTLRDNLIELPNYSHEIQNKSGRKIVGMSNNLYSEKLKNIRYKMIEAFMMSDERLKENDITFYDYINPKNKISEDWCDEFTGPIMGMESRKVTLYCVIRGFEITYGKRSINFFGVSCQVYVANGPYSLVLFNPWKNYLIKKGVMIHTNTSIVDIHYDEIINKITKITTDKGIDVIGDDYVLCVDQTSIAKLIKKNKKLMAIKMFNNTSRLHNYGNTKWFSMNLYFSEQFSPKIGTACTQEQPWSLVLENYSASWKDIYKKKCVGIVEIIQVSAKDLVPGLYGKILGNCSVEEAIKEIIDQLKRSKLFKTLKTDTGKHAFDTFMGYEIWPDWENGPDGKIRNKMDEYKFSINGKCWDLMPTTETPISNCYFGSVITKGKIPMISMEVACTNGRYAANALMKKYKNNNIPHIYNYYEMLPILSKPMRMIDKICYDICLKINLIPVLIIWIILLIIITIFILNISKRHLSNICNKR
jgi:hypothetical protein